MFQFVATGVLAGCTTIAYAGESLLYRANGWPQALADDRLYNATVEYPLIFLSYWAMLLVWMLTGSFIGAGFYRLQAGGVLILPVALVFLVVSGFGNGFMSLPFIDLGFGLHDLGVPAAVALSAACALAAWGLAWAVARDMPLRTRAT